MLKARTEMCPGIRGCKGPWELWPGFQQKRDSSCKELSSRLFARLWAEYGKVVKAKCPGAESAAATTPRVKGERAAGSPGPEETGCRRATHQELGAPERSIHPRPKQSSHLPLSRIDDQDCSTPPSGVQGEGGPPPTREHFTEACWWL